jgi:hypothetical protein
MLVRTGAKGMRAQPRCIDSSASSWQRKALHASLGLGAWFDLQRCRVQAVPRLTRSAPAGHHDQKMRQTLLDNVRKTIGPFAVPDVIHW